MMMTTKMTKMMTTRKTTKRNENVYYVCDEGLGCEIVDERGDWLPRLIIPARSPVLFQ
jgi:hypothetical protein